MVPVREDGVDLSGDVQNAIQAANVPVREDGVDLSSDSASVLPLLLRPRPRGRGGFKLV